MSEYKSVIDTLCTYQLQSDKLISSTQPLVTGIFVTWNNENWFYVKSFDQIQGNQMNDFKFIIEELKYKNLNNVNSITIYSQGEDTKIWIKIDRWFYEEHNIMSRFRLKDMYIHYDSEKLRILRNLPPLEKDKKILSKICLFGGITVLLMIPLYIYMKKYI